MKKATFLIVIQLLVQLFAFNAAAGDSARRSFEQGKELFSEGQYEDAAEKFREAYNAKPTWKLLFNIAQAEAAAKRYGLAIEAFESYLAQGGDDITADRNKEVLDEIQRLRFLVGVLQVSAPDQTEVIVDGISRGMMPEASKKRVAVGTHQVLLKLDGKVLSHTSVSISGGMTTSVSAEEDSSGAPATEPQQAADNAADDDGGTQVVLISESDVNGGAPPVPKPKNNYTGLLVGGIVTGVLSLGGVGVGIGFTAKGAGDASTRDTNATNYNQTDDPTLKATYEAAAQSAQDDLQVDGTMMIVGYAAGGALLLTSTILLIVRAKKKNSESLAIRPAWSGVLVSF
ncbi:MAG: tetratricopeptide repeat protein [Deltaproteobacteria bacterium]|nr:tetratricopeptide repeat protein [Deltaproteobacteria bacterium]MBN2672521.1 tetratricopeptide repeat protein [Deltaproteobacteria bacterium]